MKEDEKNKHNAVLSQDELERMRKLSLFKIGAMIVFAAVVIVFGSLAWFTMNREVEGQSVQMMGDDAPFEIQVSGKSGLFDDYISRVDSSYHAGTVTSGSNQNITWLLTADPKNHMENLYTEEGEPDMQQIQKLESDSYGLSPGDSGTLRLTLVPKSKGTVEVKLDLKTTFYKTEYERTGNQKDVFAPMSSNDSNEAAAMRMAAGHIQFFYMDSNNTQKRITSDGFTVTLNGTNKEVVIYWVWPEKISNIFDGNVAGLDSLGSGQVELKRFLFTHPEDLLYGLTAEEISALQVSADDENIDTTINEKIAAIKQDSKLYSHYSNKYNTADQIIADEVGYIMVEVIADTVQ